MTVNPRILALAGSVRRESFNKRLVPIAAAAARAAGATVTQIDLKDFSLPLYDGDLESEQGLPELAKQLRTLFIEHQGLIIASPEYNSSVTPLLKNALDWVSRPQPGQPDLVAFKGKVAGLISASPGALGGLRGLVHLRSILGNIGVLVLPEQAAVPQAMDAFAADGSLKDAKKQAGVEGVGRALAALLMKVAS